MRLDLARYSASSCSVAILLSMSLLPWAPSPARAQGGKLQEAVIVLQYEDPKHSDDENEAIRETSKAIKEKLIGEGMDANTYLLGNVPKEKAGQPMDLASLENLQKFLEEKAKANKYACLNNIHFVGHGSTLNEGLLFPPDSKGKPVLVKGDATKQTPPGYGEMKLEEFAKGFTQCCAAMREFFWSSAIRDRTRSDNRSPT